MRIYGDLVKDLKKRVPVIPARAGVRSLQTILCSLDSRSHGNDDFFMNSGVNAFSIPPGRDRREIQCIVSDYDYCGGM